ncbi:MAG: Ig-like domain-containing protein [Candidatus Rifleibacteriota bacterium]
MKIKIIILFTALASFITGCGSTDGGLSDWIEPTPATIVANIEGRVISPVVNLNSRAQSTNVPVKGTKVFVEEKPEFYATADEDGNFILNEIPAGKYHLIAELVSGIHNYKQRTDQIKLTGEYETLKISDPLQLENAPYKVKLNITDLKSKVALANARVKIWGREHLSSGNGDVEIGPFPEGVWPVTISATGYKETAFLLDFSSLKRGRLFVKLTPLTSVDKNRAPIVSIEQSFKTIRTNNEGTVFASGFDPDGDQLTYHWSCSAGKFHQDTGANTIFTAPDFEGKVTITVTATDEKGAESKSEVEIDVLAGGGLPVNPNNKPPEVAFDPVPANLSDNMGTEVTLRWSGSDPDGDQLNYDVFFYQRGQEPELVGEKLSQPEFQIRNLEVKTIYYWQIISRDPYGAISQTSIWQFTTGDEDNFSPYQPANPFPEDLATDQLLSFRFAWTGGDPDLDDIVTYSFYLGSDSESLELLTSTRNTNYQVENLEAEQTYYWQIIAADNRGKETKGPVWQFSTYAPPNNPPQNPVLAYPASGSTDVAIDVQMRWTAEDPDGDSLTYDVYFGKTFPLAKKGENLVAPVYSADEYLENSTRYFLQVIARDEDGLTNADSKIWSFTTAAKINQAPEVPVAIFPENAATDVSLEPVFSWSGGDPDGDKVTYELYLDTVSPPSTMLAGNLSEKSFAVINELEKGRQYYWQITADDSVTEPIMSEIYSFYTLTDTDQTAPEVLSVKPEDGALSVSSDAVVEVTFNEPVDKSVAETAFSFSPVQGGSWIWNNEVVASFLPSGGWLPGSYHEFVIADNKIRDPAGNLMTEGMTTSFTIASEIPVPDNFKSSGFPISAVPGDNVTVSVSGLETGRDSFAVAVAAGNSADFTVRASQKTAIEWFDSSPEAAFRELEKRLASKKMPSVMFGKTGLRGSVIAQQRADEVEDFYIPAYESVATSTPYPNNQIKATRYGESENVFIYVDNAINSPSSTVVSEVRKRFEEGILPKVRDVFGDEPEVGPDGQPQITILLTDALSPGIAGIFYGADLFANEPSDIQLRESNGRKMFYVKYSLNNDITRYGTLAHEFQHMVNFWQKRINAGQGVFEATWLNEGLSKYSEEVCGYGIFSGDENTALLIKLSQENFADLSVTEWSGINSYGLSYLLIRFLAQEGRYGTSYRDITRALVKSGLTGVSNVESVTAENFDTTLSRWGMSLYINDHLNEDPAQYGFKGLDLQGIHSSVSLPGFKPVQISGGGSYNVGLGKNGVMGFVRESNGEAVTEFELDGFNKDVKVWLFDQRR